MRYATNLLALGLWLTSCWEKEIDEPVRVSPAVVPIDMPNGDTVYAVGGDARAIRDVPYSMCDSVPDPDSAVAVVLTGSGNYHNEVHDCQRLVLISAGHDSTFGPLVGLFPLDSAMNLPDVSDFDTPYGVAVATIYNWGDFHFNDQPYEPLAIEDGWQCLWLRRQADQWQAAMTYDTIPCQSIWLEGSIVPTNYGDIDVYATTVQPAPHLPPTARWLWDATDKVHYIGIKCGNAWCSVGPEGFTPTALPNSGPAYRRVPGWYDAQHLAVPFGSTVKPGPWAAIYPAPQLWQGAQNGNLAALLAAGITVAEIEFAMPAAAAGPYHGKFHLEAEMNGSGRDISLQGRRTGTAPNFTYDWRAWSSPPMGGSPQEADTIIFIEHRAHASIGAVRYRWYDTDEKAWISCEYGCCTVQP